ncbi:zinc finger protein 282-like isoform X2 [Prinia subflava]|uniref:zinc finger protein 282-like isoform X2 n=1 Tax=Prinia subflava TaxID=208062 RepID=UPI002FE0386A
MALPEQGGATSCSPCSLPFRDSGILCPGGSAAAVEPRDTPIGISPFPVTDSCQSPRGLPAGGGRCGGGGSGGGRGSGASWRQRKAAAGPGRAGQQQRGPLRAEAAAPVREAGQGAGRPRRAAAEAGLSRPAVSLGRCQSVRAGAGMELAGGSTISLWTVVAAVQALERSVAAHASRLFSLEHRAGNSEKKHLDCEKMVGEFGNQLESKCAALGTLTQEYGRLQRRLENMENLLKNRNLWILRLPPGVEAPKAPAVALENDATGFSSQEWENLEEWQRELYGKVLTGKRESLVLLDDVISEPALLSRLQGGEAPCNEEEAAPGEIPAEPEALLFELNGSSWDSREAQENPEGRAGLAEPGRDCSIPEPSFAVTVKQEEEEKPYAKDRGAVEGVEFPELGVGPDTAGHNAQAAAGGGSRPSARSCEERDVRGNPADTGSEDSIIQIKQEEELCTADQEEQAAEAPGEPCPGFYKPEASSQARKGSEVDARELPGTEGEDLPREPGTGFQIYATHVSSWIKQEEEPACSEQQDLEKEEISAHPSIGENLKGNHPADGLEHKTCDLEVPGRPGEGFPKHPSHGVTWDSPWNSEMMETTTTGNGSSLGGDTQYDFFSAQEKSLEKRPCAYQCERNCPQQDQPQAPQGEGEMFPGPTCERMFPLLHPHPGETGVGLGERGVGLGEKGMGLGEKGMGLGEKGMGPGAAPTSCEGPGPRSECGEWSECGTGRPRDQDRLGTEEPAENEESFPMDTSGSSPCWEPPLARGSPAQQQSQGRGKSYICSDCGKNFVCHSWLVRHQTSHTGERPYKCSKCDKTYRRKDYLLNHQRRHTGERLFQCPLCSKRFVLKRSLLKHQEGHMQDTHVPLVSWPCRDIGGSVMHSI